MANSNNDRKKALILEAVIKFTSELLGTAALMGYGCAGLIHTKSTSNSFMQGCMNFGFTIMIIVLTFGHVSGAHVNPCVTIAALILNKITWIETLYYIVAQFIGAILGYGAMILMYPVEARHSLGGEGWTLCVTKINEDINIVQGVAIEVCLTLALVTCICGLWDPRNAHLQDSGALKVAILVASLSLVGGSWTGASMNPPRSFAPALFAGDWENHWVYYVGPLSGSCIAAVVYKYVFLKAKEETTI